VVRKAKPVKPRLPRQKKTGRGIQPPPASQANGPLLQGVRPAEKLAALDRLAERDGIGPVTDPDDLIAPFWPADETADDLVTAIRDLRRQGR
jgi:hypothetical protein